MGWSGLFLLILVGALFASIAVPVLYLMIKDASQRRAYMRNLDDTERMRFANFRSIGAPWREFTVEREKRMRKRRAH